MCVFGYSFGSRCRPGSVFWVLKKGPFQIFRQDPVGFGTLIVGSVPGQYFRYKYYVQPYFQVSPYLTSSSPVEGSGT